MSDLDLTGDDIKYMIELATKELAHHKTQVTLWEQTLSRLQKTQQHHTTHQNVQKTQIQALELELAKAKTTGGTAAIPVGGTNPAKQGQVNTTFNTPVSRPAFSSRPSLVAIQQQHNQAQVFSAQQQQQQQQQRQAQQQQQQTKPKLIARVLYSFEGMPEKNVMSLTADEYLIVHNTDGDWYMCQRTHDKVEPIGPQQFAPRNYLQLVEIDDELPPSAPKVTNMTVRGVKTPTVGHATLNAAQAQNVQQQLQQQQQQQQQAHTQPHAVQAAPNHHTPTLSSWSSSHTANTAPASIPSAASTPMIATTSTATTPTVAAGPASRGPPPFRGSVGPTSQSAVAAAAATASFQQPNSPANGSRASTFAVPSKSGGPPPFPGAAAAVPPPPKPVAPTCTALFDYKVDDPTILSFSRGDVFTIVGDTTSSEWWRVSDSKGNMGYIPSNYVKKN